MLARLRPRSAYDVMALLALIVALTTGTAYAADTVFSTDIVNGEVKTVDLADRAVSADKIRPGAVGGTKIANESVTGSDIDEGTLGEVPSATSAALGGIGRTARSGRCDVGTSFTTCAFTSITLPRQSRVLIMGSVKPVPTNPGAEGQCLLASNEMDFTETTSGFETRFDPSIFVPITTLKMLDGGSYDLAIRCRTTGSAMSVFDATVTVVTLTTR